jgi:hypothetical protein
MDPVCHLAALAAFHREEARRFEAAAARLFFAELQPLVADEWEKALRATRDLTRRKKK